MDCLPPEVLINIFSRLSVISLSNVKLVCRKWHKLAQDPLLLCLLCSDMTNFDQCLILHSDHPVRNQIYAMYLYKHEESLGMVRNIHVSIMPEFDVIGSCNGLLCFSNHTKRNEFYVYNPAINCCAQLPKAMQYVDCWTVFGFGMLPTTKEYKLVKIAKNVNQDYYDVEILTLGSSTWRNLGQTSYYPIPSPSQVLVNGRLHWVSWPRSRHHPGRNLLSFDLANEKFREVPRPESADLEREHFELLILGGCLSAAYYTSYGKWQIWIMKKYGVKKSWINELNIGNYISRGVEQDINPSFRKSKFYERRCSTRFLCRLKNGEILINYMCRAIVAYDPMSRTFREIEIEGMPHWFEAMVQMSSLNWIDNLTAI